MKTIIAVPLKNRYYEKWLNEINKGNDLSSGFKVDIWTDKKTLYEKIEARLLYLMNEEKVPDIPKKSQRLNKLLGLTNTGHVKNQPSHHCPTPGIDLSRKRICSGNSISQH